MFEFFFKYSPAVFRESSLTLANHWPIWGLFLGLAIFAVILVASLVRRRRSLEPWQLACLGSLQLLMVALVLLVLWQPSLVTERLVQGENTVALVLDTSASMATVDGNSTRMGQARQLLQADNLNKIAETYTILRYGFAGNADALDDFENLPPPGNATNIGSSLLETLRQSSSTSLGAVVLFSDGADNNNAIAQSVLNDILDYRVPIHTIGLGRELMPEDLELEEVMLPERALPGTTMSARLRIRHDQGGQARVRVYDGDTFLSTTNVELNPNDSSTLTYIDIDAEEPGQLDLRFTVDPLEGERQLGNNTRSRVVDVRESRYRILYVEGEPRWEYKFMQRALNEDPSIQLSTLLRVSPNKYYRQGIEDPEELADGFPTERRDLYRYDALIIGSVNVAEFSSEQQALIRDFVSERGGTLMMMAGLSGLGLGDWGSSVVNDILPARLNTGSHEFVRQQVPAFVSRFGETSPILQFSDDPRENARQWSGLPAVADYQNIGPLRPAATTLLEVEVEGRRQPLLVSQPYGRGQSYILASGGTWRWQMNLPSDDKRHETFWRQLSRALVASSPRPFELSSRVEGDSIRVRAEVRDPEAEENRGLQVTAIVSTPENEALNFDLLPVAGKPGTWEASFRPSGNGLFSIEAISRIDDEPVSSVTTATRYDQGNEAFNIRQNRPLLERLSAATGGQYWTPEQWDEMAEAIAWSDAGITEQELRYLWDAPIFFLLLFILKAAEWLLRRRWSSI